MKRTLAALIATTLVACQSAESDPDNAMLADAQITETPDAAPPDAPLPPPPPTMARVRVSVSGAPLTGAPVVFHGPDGDTVTVGRGGRERQ